MNGLVTIRSTGEEQKFFVAPTYYRLRKTIFFVFLKTDSLVLTNSITENYISERKPSVCLEILLGLCTLGARLFVYLPIGTIWLCRKFVRVCLAILTTWLFLLSHISALNNYPLVCNRQLSEFFHRAFSLSTRSSYLFVTYKKMRWLIYFGCSFKTFFDVFQNDYTLCEETAPGCLKSINLKIKFSQLRRLLLCRSQMLFPEKLKRVYLKYIVRN